MLKIKNLNVEIEEKILLRDFNLSVKPGEVHAIMGPNGAGKSTLANVISGHPSYKILSGEVLYQGRDLLKLPPEERALNGIFVSFQYPLEISGISNFEFLHAAYNARQKALNKNILSIEEFEKILFPKMQFLGIKEEFIKRNINEGFSGGEKKRNEILQMALLSPRLAILDEIDSGLDIDALKLISDKVNRLKNKQNSFILITHYPRLLNYIAPDFIHIVIDGTLIMTTTEELFASKLEEKGYEWLAEANKKDV